VFGWKHNTRAFLVSEDVSRRRGVRSMGGRCTERLRCEWRRSRTRLKGFWRAVWCCWHSYVFLFGRGSGPTRRRISITAPANTFRDPKCSTPLTRYP